MIIDKISKQSKIQTSETAINANTIDDDLYLTTSSSFAPYPCWTMDTSAVRTDLGTSNLPPQSVLIVFDNRLHLFYLTNHYVLVNSRFRFVENTPVPFYQVPNNVVEYKGRLHGFSNTSHYMKDGEVWTQIATVGSSNPSNTCVHNNKMYRCWQGSTYVFDDTLNTWIIESTQGGRAYPLVSFENTLYSIGGTSNSSGYSYVYDESAKTWSPDTATRNLPYALGAGTVVTVSPRSASYTPMIMVFGQYYNVSSSYKDYCCYRTKTNWNYSSYTNFNFVQRQVHPVASDGKSIYILTELNGYNSGVIMSDTYYASNK